MRRLGLVLLFALICSTLGMPAPRASERPILYFGSPEDYDPSHYPAMESYFEPIRRFFNGLSALRWDWRYVEPRQYAVDLNGDGQDEYILDGRIRQLNMYTLNLYSCPVTCYTMLTVVEIERDADGAIIGPRHLGTIATPHGAGYEVGFDEHILSIGEPGPNGWRSISNGPLKKHVDGGGSVSGMVGGQRFCFTDKPEPIDFSQFHWNDERGNLADLLTIGLPYRDGGPGYFKIVGYDEECPE